MRRYFELAARMASTIPVNAARAPDARGDVAGRVGADDDIQLAWLCHAAYGTDGFDVALLGLDERTVLAEAIGENAEALVYLYASCDRKQTYAQLAQPVVTFTNRFDDTQRTPPQSHVRAFVEITAANEWDVVQNNNELARRYRAELTQLLADAGRYLSESARTAWTTPPNSAGFAPNRIDDRRAASSLSPRPPRGCSAGRGVRE